MFDETEVLDHSDEPCIVNDFVLTGWKLESAVVATPVCRPMVVRRHKGKTEAAFLRLAGRFA